MRIGYRHDLCIYVNSECPASILLSVVVLNLPDVRTHYQLHCADRVPTRAKQLSIVAGSEFGPRLSRS